MLASFSVEPFPRPVLEYNGNVVGEAIPVSSGPLSAGAAAWDSLVERHCQVYDSLADEYERRVAQLKPAVKGAIDLLSRNVRPGPVLDVGCGVGSSLEEMQQRGFEPSGIDISSKMVRLAQRRNPGLSVIRGDFLGTTFNQRYDAVLALAFIHLFPRRYMSKILHRMRSLLSESGVLYIGTTKADVFQEGFEAKTTYPGAPDRFRVKWTRPEFEKSLSDGGFAIVDSTEISDVFGKVWMDFVATPQR